MFKNLVNLCLILIIILSSTATKPAATSSSSSSSTIKSLPITGPDSYETRIKLFRETRNKAKKYKASKNYLDALESFKGAEKILEDIKKAAQREIENYENSLPLRSYLAGEGFYPAAKVGQKNPKKALQTLQEGIQEIQSDLEFELAEIEPEITKLLPKKESKRAHVLTIEKPSSKEETAESKEKMDQYTQYFNNCMKKHGLIENPDLVSFPYEILQLTGSYICLSFDRWEKSEELLEAINQRVTPTKQIAHLDYIRNLLEQGADANYVPETGDNALISAIKKTNEHSHYYDYYKNLIELLLIRGANINFQDNYGSTALMYAAMNGLDKTVNLLLENHSDVNLKNLENNTALSLARSLSERQERDKRYYVGNAKRIIELLLKHGAIE